MSDRKTGVSRRSFLKQSAIVSGAAAAGGLLPWRFAIGQQAPVRIGLLLPYAGTYAALGENITDAFKMRLDEAGGRLGGRQFEIVQVDSEFSPPKAAEKTNRLINSDKVDFIVGPVHSGVAMSMAKICREEGTIMVVPNAGADQVTGVMCAPNIFRTSFTNWQPGYATGQLMARDGIKSAVSMFWKYGAGIQAADGFKEAFTSRGGKVLKEIGTPFPKVEFQAYLTEIAAMQPEAVFMFYAGGGAVKINKDWAAAGLKGRVKLYGSGFLTEGILGAVGDAAEGVRTALHYADGIDTPINKSFRANFKRTTGREADVYAVQGYDAATLLINGMTAVGGDTSRSSRGALIAAMESQAIDSPRGRFTLSKAHNPIQDMYAREVRNGANVIVGMAARYLEDPARGCKA